MAKITADELAKTIEETLREFKDVTEEAAQKGVETTAKEAVEELHNAKPSGSGKWGSWDKYNAGWTYKKMTSTKKSSGVVVHNATHYQLTHLLENGHALVGGGRAQAFPHIAPVAERAEENLLRNIKENIS